MFLLMLLLSAYPMGAQLPSEVVLDSVYSGQNSTHSIAFKPTTFPSFVLRNLPHFCFFCSPCKTFLRQHPSYNVKTTTAHAGGLL